MARAQAIYQLCFAEDENKKIVVPILIKSLQDNNVSVAIHGAFGLGTLGVEPEVAVPALTNSLQDPRWQVRFNVSVSLGRFGHQAGDAVPALLRSAEDPSPAVRSEVTNALLKIAPEVLKTNMVSGTHE